MVTTKPLKQDRIDGFQTTQTLKHLLSEPTMNGLKIGRLIRSYLKKVFWPNFFVGASFKILEILKYACGFKLGPAANLNQNPFFEMASNKRPGVIVLYFTGRWDIPNQTSRHPQKPMADLTPTKSPATRR